MRHLDLGKALSFLLITVGLSLAQVLLLAIVLLAKGDDLSAPKLLADGGLLFFSLTLVSVSLFSLLDHSQIKKGTAAFNISLVVFLLCPLPSAAFYAAITAQNLDSPAPNPSPFGPEWPTQLVFASIAIAYAFYAEMSTGTLTRVRSRHGSA